MRILYSVFRIPHSVFRSIYSETVQLHQLPAGITSVQRGVVYNRAREHIIAMLTLGNDVVLPVLQELNLAREM